MVYVPLTCLICGREDINWSPVPAAYMLLVPEVRIDPLLRTSVQTQFSMPLCTHRARLVNLA